MSATVTERAARGAAPYRTIVADPPWTPALGGTWAATADKSRPQRFYQTMTLDEICAMDVQGAEQSHLYMWALTQHVDWGYQACRAWGFEPVTMLTWCKGRPGTGRFQCNTEHCIVARKGSRHGNPFSAGAGGTWFTWPAGRHSAKPAEFYDLVNRLSPGPYLELFARCDASAQLPGTCQCAHHRLGWDMSGNEADRSAPPEAAS